MGFQRQLEQFCVRVVLWFVENPDEELTTADVAVKFDYSAAAVHGALKQAIAAGWVQRTEHGRCLPAVYSAGPRIVAAFSRAGACTA